MCSSGGHFSGFILCVEKPATVEEEKVLKTNPVLVSHLGIPSERLACVRG